MCKWGAPQNIQPNSFGLLGHQRSGSTERADYSHPGARTGLHSWQGCCLHGCCYPALPKHPSHPAPHNDPSASAPAPLHQKYPIGLHMALDAFHHYWGLTSAWESLGHWGLPKSYAAADLQCMVWRSALRFKSMRKPIPLQVRLSLETGNTMFYQEGDGDPRDQHRHPPGWQQELRDGPDKWPSSMPCNQFLITPTSFMSAHLRQHQPNFGIFLRIWFFELLFLYPYTFLHYKFTTCPADMQPTRK